MRTIAFEIEREVIIFNYFAAQTCSFFYRSINIIIYRKDSHEVSLYLDLFYLLNISVYTRSI